jgi:hypothetical protein
MSEATLYCANHPTVETVLRCKKCEKLICVKCAVRTPTGYQCKECVRGQQKIFETSKAYDYVTGFIAAAFLSGLGSFLVGLLATFIGFFGIFITFLASPTAAVLIAEAVRLVTGRRRSPKLFKVVLVGVVLGAIPLVLLHLLFFDIYGLIIQGVYLFLVAPTAYYRISGIRILK